MNDRVPNRRTPIRQTLEERLPEPFASLPALPEVESIAPKILRWIGSRSPQQLARLHQLHLLQRGVLGVSILLLVLSAGLLFYDVRSTASNGFASDSASGPSTGFSAAAAALSFFEFDEAVTWTRFDDSEVLSELTLGSASE